MILTAGLLQAITAAVTPAVMLSVAAVLILGVNNKHQAMADRIRALMAEVRQPGTTPDRQASILLQIEWFHRRIGLSGVAHRLLYAAVAVFLITVLLIIVAPERVTWTTPAGFILFVLGVTLMLIAVLFESTELSWSNRTLRLEMADLPRPK